MHRLRQLHLELAQLIAILRHLGRLTQQQLIKPLHLPRGRLDMPIEGGLLIALELNVFELQNFLVLSFDRFGIFLYLRLQHVHPLLEVDQLQVVIELLALVCG